MALFKNWPVDDRGLGSLFPPKGGERIKPRPTTRRPMREFIGEPIPFRPTIPAEQEPGRLIDKRPLRSGVSLRALKAQRQQLREQLRQIEAQIRSLGRELPIRDPWDFGPEPPMPVLPRPPMAIPIGPPTMPVPTIPIGPGGTVPQPPPMPPRPPWGG